MKFATLVIMVLLMGFGMRHGQRYIMQAAGMPAMPTGVPGVAGVQFSSEESDLMSTVFKSALRLFSGSAKREELASELSDKLYAGRAGAGEMSELGIELVKPGGGSSAPAGGGGTANLPPGAKANAQPDAKANDPAGASANAQNVAKTNSSPGAKAPAKSGVPGGGAPAVPASNKSNDALTRVWERVKPYSMEMGLVPVVFLGMVLVHRIRRRRSPKDAFMLPDLAITTPTDSEPYDMKHAVHSLGTEDFELLVALIYHRQGYRVTMPAGLSGGRGGDFTLARKSERVLVQCKKLSLDHRVPVDRVRELHEAMTAAGMPRGLYVASCGFTWDARNFAKTRGVTLINARTLDELLLAARETPGEDLLSVSQWVSKLMSKVKLTPPICPACEATMDEINASHGSVWVCSQRPDCRGRRSARKYQKTVPTVARTTDTPADGPVEPTKSAEPARAKPTAPSPTPKSTVPSPTAQPTAPSSAAKPAAPSPTAKPTAPSPTSKPVAPSPTSRAASSTPLPKRGFTNVASK